MWASFGNSIFCFSTFDDDDSIQKSHRWLYARTKCKDNIFLRKTSIAFPFIQNAINSDYIDFYYLPFFRSITRFYFRNCNRISVNLKWIQILFIYIEKVKQKCTLNFGCWFTEIESRWINPWQQIEIKRFFYSPLRKSENLIIYKIKRKTIKSAHINQFRYCYEFDLISW